jgi:plastocyanin
METPFVARARVAALITTVGLSGALATTAQAAPATVTVDKNAFGPSAVSIDVGESVTWNFKEPSHNVKGQGGISGNNSFGTGTYTKTFDAAGTFSYYCEAHPDMKGSVTVAAAPAPQGPDPAAAPGAGAGAGATGGESPTAAAAAAAPAAWTFPSSEDRRSPAVRSLRATMRRGAKRPVLSMRLSEDATIVVGIRRVLSARTASAGAKTLRLEGRRGANRFSLRAGKLRKGRYRLRLVAIDGSGNESAIRTVTLRVR